MAAQHGDFIQRNAALHERTNRLCGFVNQTVAIPVNVKAGKLAFVGAARLGRGVGQSQRVDGVADRLGAAKIVVAAYDDGIGEIECVALVEALVVVFQQI